MRKLLTTVAAALVLMPQLAAAAEPACLTPAEFTALSSYALPSIISGTTQRCTATLPANAWLRQNGAQLASRYAAAKPAAWPVAKTAFFKLSSNSTETSTSNIMKSLPDGTLQLMLDGFVEGMIGQRLPAERCGVIDQLVRLLAPLPPENTAELIALAAGLGSKSGRGRLGTFSLCPA